MKMDIKIEINNMKFKGNNKQKKSYNVNLLDIIRMIKILMYFNYQD